MNNNEMVEIRLDSLEQKISQQQKERSEMDKSVVQIGEAIKAISRTMYEIKDAISRFERFEAKAEEMRVNDKDHRDRLDRRIDELTKDLTNVNRSVEAKETRIYDRLRAVEAESKECMSEASTARELIRERISSTKEIMNERQSNSLRFGDRFWKFATVVFGVFIAALLSYISQSNK